MNSTSFELYKNNLKDLVIPNHIAIILDGNGTWAKNINMPRTYGHKEGCKTLINIVNYCNYIGLKYLTLYCFSTENWKRPVSEVNYLMRLFSIMVRLNKDKLNDYDIRLKFIGSKNKLSNQQIEIIDKAEEATKDNLGLTLNIAFNYGSHEEIINACKNICKDVTANKIDISDINDSLFNNYLYTKDSPSVDLLIRTSFQQRISNFLLWQIAYSELYFTKTLWPDFSPNDLNIAIEEYNKRERRFGGVK